MEKHIKSKSPSLVIPEVQGSVVSSGHKDAIFVHRKGIDDSIVTSEVLDEASYARY